MRVYARTPSQKAALAGDPLLRILDEIIQPDVDPARYAELKTAVTEQLARERRQEQERHAAHAPRGGR